MKWPKAVFHLLSAGGVPAGSLELYNLLASTIRFADGKNWSEDFNRMRVGRSDATTGLLVNATNIGVIRHASGAVDHADASVALGINGLRFVFEPPDRPVEVLEEARKKVEAAGPLRWPSSTDEIPAFADAILKVTTSVRASDRSDGLGLRGGRSHSKYGPKHFTRLVLFQICEYLGTDAFNGFTVGQTLQWVPDEGGHCNCIASLRGDVAAKAFALNCLMISLWTCLMSDVGERSAGAISPEANLAALTTIIMASDRYLWAPVREFETVAGPDIFPLNPRAIWSAIKDAAVTAPSRGCIEELTSEPTMSDKELRNPHCPTQSSRQRRRFSGKTCVSL